MAILYTHIAGPYKGGLCVDYDKSIPFLPIKLRDKNKQEIAIAQLDSIIKS